MKTGVQYCLSGTLLETVVQNGCTVAMRSRPGREQKLRDSPVWGVCVVLRNQIGTVQ